MPPVYPRFRYNNNMPSTTTATQRTYVLAVLDGWGLGPADQGNPIHVVAPRSIATIESRYPGIALQASGLAVGLPWDEEGNSEVGHITLGAGRASEQHSERVTHAIESGVFESNDAFARAFAHARENKSSVRFIGLLTSGIVHASFSHLAALVRLAGNHPDVPVLLDLMTDGIDSGPREARTLFTKLVPLLPSNVRLGTVGGRYYGMDRDRHYDRTEKAYRALTGRAGRVASWDEVLQTTYGKGLNDEFVEPVFIGDAPPITRGDALIFFNFREDSIRALADAFTDPEFSFFSRAPLDNLFVVTMTSYRPKSPAVVAFPTPALVRTFGEIIADRGLRQLRIGETAKYAHITYFFNGLREEPFRNEFRILIPSLAASRKDEQPAMQAHAITDRAILALQERSFDFILMNYANPDIIAHTGNYAATVAAIETVDRELARLCAAVEEGGHVLILTADHGNAEVLIDPRTGEIETKHNPNPVPCYCVAKEFARHSPSRPNRLEVQGLLSDVAPTLLELMGVPKPQEMTGTSLLPYFQS